MPSLIEAGILVMSVAYLQLVWRLSRLAIFVPMRGDRR
jgi:hypothetical protein